MLNPTSSRIPKISFGPAPVLHFLPDHRWLVSDPGAPSLLIPCCTALFCILCLHFSKASAIIPGLCFWTLHHGVSCQHFILHRI